jgi:chromosome partitioning protein
MTSDTTADTPARILEKTRVIVFALKAGGTAKTSSATSLAVILGQRGYRVLLIDLDPQCNSSQVLGYSTFNPGQPGITDVIKQQVSFKDAIVPARYVVDDVPDPSPDDPEWDRNAGYELIPNVWILPGNTEDPEIDDMERLLNDQSNEDVYWIRDGLEEMDGAWDAILIDCPATYGRSTVCAFVALDDTVDGEVLPPVLCTFKEAGALVKLEERLEEIRANRKYARKGIQPQMKHILVCSAPNASFGTKEHWRTLEEIREEYGDKLLPLIHWSGEVPKIYRDECPVPILFPKSMPTQEYQKVATALGFPHLG